MSNSRFLRAGLGLALAAFATAFAVVPAAGRQYSPALYAGLRWRLIGPFRAGRTQAVSGVAGSPNTYYFGAVDGGVWKSPDSGRTWRPIFDRQPIGSIGALAVAPSDPNVIYVGTGEADMRSDISFGDGMYKSTDGGRTWTHIGLEATRHIGAIVVDPRNPDLVLVAALGRAYGPNSERGVYRSSDGGRSWSKVLYENENVGAIDLAMDAANPRLLFAALWNARRPPWNQYPPTQGPGSGLYQSSDEGLTWRPVVGHGLPTSQWGRAGVAFAAPRPGGAPPRVYALVTAKQGSGLYRSDDNGRSWKLVSDDARLVSRSWYFSGVYPDPRDANVVYVCDVGLYKSMDGGMNFSVLKGAPGGDDYHTLWINPRDPRRLILGSDQGVAVSVDDGRTWSSWYNQPTAQFYHVITDNQWPYWVYGSQQDSGTAAVKSRSDYGVITFRDWHPIGGGESGYVAPDPLDPNIVYGGSTGGVVMRYNNVTGQSQNVSPWPGEDKYRWTWTFPLVFSPQNPHLLYAGSQYVLLTSDGGASWRAISPDLTRYAAGEPEPANPDEARLYNQGKDRGVVYTIAPSAARAGEIWAGTDDGLIWLTRDGGGHWDNVTPAGLPAWSKISLLDAARDDAATAYAAVDRHRADDFRPYIYRTHDFGRTWREVSSGIPAGDYVHAVRADPETKGLLYAGTEKGVFVSFNDGDQWQSLRRNLPVTSIRDLVVHDNDLIVATHGRSFWILDDVTPLRQIAAAAAASPAYLYAPELATRVRLDEGQDTPWPPEEPHGRNPPPGAVVDYALSAPPNGAVTLTIRDARGRLVRQFSSAVAQPQPPPGPYSVANYWLTPARPLPAKVGMNRFVWNLRYPTPESLAPDFGIWATPHRAVQVPEGALALPGRYQLELRVDGRSYTRTLDLREDPRVHPAPGALAAQLALEQTINGGIDATARAVQQIGALRAQLAALEPRLSAAPAALAAARALDGQLAALAGEAASPYGTGALGSGFIKANGDLSNLSMTLDSADAAPTAQDEAAYRQISAQVAVLNQRWRQARERDVPALNRLLAQSGVGVIGAP